MDCAFLNMTPHALRQGRAVHETLQGMEMATILHSRRWTDKSKAFDAYTRTDFIALPPAQIMTDYPQCKKKWTSRRLQFLLKNILESAGSPESHLHWQRLKQLAPDKISILSLDLPATFPHQQAAARMHCEERDSQSRVYLQQQVNERAREEARFQRCSAMAKALREAALIKRYRPTKCSQLSAKARQKTRQPVPEKPGYVFDNPDFYNKAAQTEGTFAPEQPTIEYKGKQVPVHPDALDLIPTETAFKLCMTKTGVCLRGLGTERKSLSAPHKNKVKVSVAMLHRISLRHRLFRADQQKADKKMIPCSKITKWRYNGHLCKLNYHFMLEYLTKGEQGLPMINHKLDLLDTDNEVAEEILEQNKTKPANYERSLLARRRLTVASCHARHQKGGGLDVPSDSDSSDCESSNTSEKPPAKRSGGKAYQPPPKRCQTCQTAANDNAIQPPSATNQAAVEIFQRQVTMVNGAEFLVVDIPSAEGEGHNEPMQIQIDWGNGEEEPLLE